MNKTWITSLAVIVIFTTCGVLLVNSRFGAKLGSQIKGDETFLYPLTSDLGQCEAGETREVVFNLCNLTSKGVVVAGIVTSCSCTACDDLPLTIEAKSTALLKIKARLPKYESSFNKEITFLVEESRGMAMRKARILATIPNPLPIPPKEAVTDVDENSTLEIPIEEVIESDEDVQSFVDAVEENPSETESRTKTNDEITQI